MLAVRWMYYSMTSDMLLFNKTTFTQRIETEVLWYIDQLTMKLIDGPPVHPWSDIQRILNLPFLWNKK
jgi:hypothetical protein